ncbi:hypothetical protein VAE151_500266 [Vibrio aestuarianus]|uniref:Uncharacterized protein n=1 Tax=Vibrio aestuarianus TaxID=28171 RepID=A0ABM9FM35_9VIBR|nr:hypothetical protein VIBAE_A10266 [Vibrio aestuarianus subsp. francensis]CAH8184001.1 hypothetical protein VAE032_220267 [Vibrio aestuarianus]CAH8184065.1 hypothetical protein VAE055_320268 [Vibrio aestuarianus]CAH8184168.1 hypothetical protein VAE128_420268 [Vibrio aestuarianus]CAH8184215.1 hypothetical protein VAE130_530266 [Vibrio aestuarianus]
MMGNHKHKTAELKALFNYILKERLTFRQNNLLHNLMMDTQVNTSLNVINWIFDFPFSSQHVKISG